MSELIATRIDPAVYGDMLGAPFRLNGRSLARGIDCYGLVLEMYKRRGVTLPDLTYNAGTAARLGEIRGQWSRLAAPTIGCAVIMRRDQTAPDSQALHIGIYVGDGLVLHAAALSGVTLSRFDELPVVQCGDWIHAHDAPMESVPENSILVIEYDAMLNRSVRIIPWQDGLTISDICGDGWHIAQSDFRRGGCVVLSRLPGDIVSILVNLLIAVFLSVVSMLIMPGPPTNDPESPGSSYFDISGLSNTSGLGYAQQIVYGEMRVAGHILSAFQRANANNETTLHLLIGLGFGQFKSIGTLLSDQNNTLGSAIPKSIELDGNAASQYTGISVSTRLGSNNQGALPYFNESVVSTAYDSTLLRHSVSTPNRLAHESVGPMTAFEVNISYPQGLYAANSSGGIGASTVEHTVYWLKKGDPVANEQSTSVTLTLSRRSSFMQTIRIPQATNGVILPLISAEYIISVARTTAWPASDASTFFQSRLASISEITADEIAYTGRAVIGITVGAQEQLSGRIPTVTCSVEGKHVYVWDGVSVTSPTLTLQYSDNPAWCILDLLLNNQFGMGRNGRITIDNIGLTSFLEWAQHCDTMVDDGRGGTVKRARFGAAIDQTTSGWDYATKAAACHWGKLMLVGNKIKVVVEKASTPIYSFSAGNVRDVAISYTGRSQRPNVIEVQYLNSENNYEADWATKTDATAVFTNGESVVKQTLQSVGVTRAAQAYRLAQYLQNTARLSVQQLSFTAGPESLHLLPGDVIYFNHDAVTGEAGGRILGATSTTVTIDSDIVASGGTGRINCRTNGDTFEERTLTNGTYARGAAITVTAAWTSTPTAGAPYLAGASTSYRKTFRISTIDTEPDLSRKFACTQYDASIYSDDPGTVETFTDDMPDPRTLPALPANVRASSEHILGADDGSEDYLRVEWTPAAGWHSADIWLKATDDAAASWECRGRHHGGNALLCCGIRPNTSYAVSVVPVGPRGNALGSADSGAVVFVYTRGRTWPPDAPAAQSASVTAGILSASVSTVDGATQYEWRVGRTWSGSVVMAVTKEPKLVMPIPWWGTGDIMCRSVSSTGTRSESSATFAALQPVANESFQQVDLAHSADGLGWPGTKTDIAIGATAAITGSALTGSYTTAALTPYLDGQHQSVRVFANCGLQNVAMTWDHAIFNWDDAHADQTWATAYLTGAELKENLTWEEAGQTWAGFGGQMYTWGGPVDIDAALASTVSVNTNAAGLVAFTETVEDTISTVAARVTLNRPHVDYITECREFTVNTLHYSMTEPERFTLEYFATSATGANGRVHGLISTNSADAKFKVPTGKILTILGCNAVATTGATAGTYTVNAIIRNTTDSADVIVASASTASVSTRLHINAQGTRIAPLAILAAGKEYQIGWHNAASSPGALTSAPQVVNFTAILETA